MHKFQFFSALIAAGLIHTQAQGMELEDTPMSSTTSTNTIPSSSVTDKPSPDHLIVQDFLTSVGISYHAMEEQYQGDIYKQARSPHYTENLRFNQTSFHLMRFFKGDNLPALISSLKALVEGYRMEDPHKLSGLILSLPQADGDTPQDMFGNNGELSERIKFALCFKDLLEDASQKDSALVSEMIRDLLLQPSESIRRSVLLANLTMASFFENMSIFEKTLYFRKLTSQSQEVLEEKQKEIEAFVSLKRIFKPDELFDHFAKIFD